MQKVDSGAITRLIILTIVLINTILEMKGMTLIPFDEGLISEFVSIFALIVTTIWTYWKNNNITQNAQKAQEFKKQLDKGEVDFDGQPIVKEESKIEVDNTHVEEDGLGGGRVD
ncbi:phage holin [Macrococcoides bohemicum]|uniref:Phage holin n=1 Tax=Macrococcoides bohemicum TaxID=1903056 RepID=A0AAJ4PAG5_9STAP|nr:phage holin [Macrococcus bohemicus]QYA42054.1 phage holin [Macrococcus bohemicus]